MKSVIQTTVIPERKSCHRHPCQRCWTFFSQRQRRPAYRGRLQIHSWRATCALPWRPPQYRYLRIVVFVRQVVNQKLKHTLPWRTEKARCHQNYIFLYMIIINVLNLNTYIHTCNKQNKIDKNIPFDNITHIFLPQVKLALLLCDVNICLA